MQKQSYEVEVLINGKPAKEYAHKGKVWIEGRKGTPFSIRLRNNSWGRKLFVPTIDGLSVMDGEEGSYESGGYIVNGYSSVTIDGWRTSDKEVATFYFSSPEGSYRKRMKKGDNLGVIGVAVFSEKKNYPAPTVTYSSSGWDPNVTNGSGGTFYTTTLDSTPKEMNFFETKVTNFTSSNSLSWDGNSSSSVMRSCASMNSGSTPMQKLGTGWGDQKVSEVNTVNFDRETNPDTVFEIRYNTREELEKEGINFKKEPLYVTPQAFPGQYCKPPRN